MGDVVVDIGANVGLFTVKTAMEIGESGKVIAIEPVEMNFRLLEKNVMSYNLKNVVIFKKAIGANKRKDYFVISSLSATHQLKHVTKIPETPKYEIEIEVETLDNICKYKDLDIFSHEINLLKIDVEGAELEVLKGAEESLKITRNIVMELHYDGEYEEIKEFLEERGFTIHVIRSILYANNISILSQ